MVRSVICLALAAFAVLALGEDAGKVVCPGFVTATFTGQEFDAESDIWSNVSAHEVFPSKIYATELPEKNTVGYAAYNGGTGGCQKAAQYGILWKKSSEANWRKVEDPGDGSQFRTSLDDWSQVKVDSPVPVILSSKMRESDPTVMDVSYIVLANKDAVNARALAFEDGERSFWKVVRPETFIEGTDKNIGDGIAANVEHKLSWKVSKDWDTDLAKLKFEILVSDVAQLPMKHAKIAERGRSPSLTVAYGTQTDEDIFNAMLWYYADGAVDLVNNDGYVDTTNGIRLVNRTALANRLEPLRYVYDKMGYEALVGGNLLSYARRATRRDLQFNSKMQNSAVLKSSKPTELYVGEKAYCVIDLSGGVYANSYPVSYLDSEPCDGWDEEYKTTKLLMRRIEPGVFMMQGNREVTLTKPFYIGVYPVTQKQYELVMGKNPSFEKGDLIPVQVSWNEARGDSAVYNWPTVRTVDQDSFFGRVQAKSGQKIDLPTEAQWEYACRAGTKTLYNNGGDSDMDLDVLGHYDTAKPVEIGLYQPNLWGLYDMHGNIGQLCLDWDGALTTDPVVDPSGPDGGENRIMRAHYFANFSKKASDSNSRVWCPPGANYPNLNYGGCNSPVGIRVCVIVEL